VTDRADVVVRTLGVANGGVTDADEATAMLHCRVYVNEIEIPQVLAVETASRGGEFAEVTVRISPRRVRYEPLSQAEWDALG
jgi:hypothetical protein